MIAPLITKAVVDDVRIWLSTSAEDNCVETA